MSVGFKTSEGKMTMGSNALAGLGLFSGLIGEGATLTWEMVALIGIVGLVNVGYALARGLAKNGSDGS